MRSEFYELFQIESGFFHVRIHPHLSMFLSDFVGVDYSPFVLHKAEASMAPTRQPPPPSSSFDTNAHAQTYTKLRIPIIPITLSVATPIGPIRESNLNFWLESHSSLWVKREI